MGRRPEFGSPWIAAHKSARWNGAAERRSFDPPRRGGRPRLGRQRSFREPWQGAAPGLGRDQGWGSARLNPPDRNVSSDRWPDAPHSNQLDAHQQLDCASRVSRITAPRSSTRIQRPQWRSDSAGCNPGWDALNSKRRSALRAGPDDRASRSQWNCSSNCYKCGRRCR